jgi:hypothetical protein
MAPSFEIECHINVGDKMGSLVQFKVGDRIKHNFHKDRDTGKLWVGTVVQILPNEYENIRWRADPEFYTYARREYIPGSGDCHREADDMFTLLASANPSQTMDVSQSAVNDHTCAACGNTRCGRTEKNCWKCGTKIEVRG